MKTFRKIFRRAVSPLIATIILIAICVAGGLLVYSIFMSTSSTMSAKGQISVEAIDLVKDTGGNVAFSITLKNTGNKPVSDLKVNLAGTDYTVTLPSSVLQPGQSASHPNTNPTAPTGGFIAGNSYNVVIKATFSDTSTFTATTSVRCRSG
jgi:flagellin-like protein